MHHALIHSICLPNFYQLENWTSQYLKESRSEYDNYGIPYSYESIMHYDSSSPEGGDPQIMYAKVPDMDSVMGQQSHLAETDIQLMKKIYKCP